MSQHIAYLDLGLAFKYITSILFQAMWKNYMVQFIIKT